MATETQLLTAEQLAEIQDDRLLYELVRGELMTSPPPGAQHGETAAEVLLLVGSFVRSHALGRIYGAGTGFRIGRNPDTVRAPCFAFVSHDRLPAGLPPVGYLDLAPDLVVEIVSPSDRAQEIQQKMQEWMQAGARQGWLLYPANRRVAVYRSDADVHIFGPDDELDGETVPAGFRCHASDLFPQTHS